MHHFIFSDRKNAQMSFLTFFFAFVAEKFTEHLVKYQDFVNNPGIIEDPNLVICINSKFATFSIQFKFLV